MEGENEGVMFEVGVMTSPNAGKKLEELAKQVMDYQKAMNDGVTSIGKSAVSIKQSMTSLTEQMREYKKLSVETAAEVRSVMSAVQDLASIKVTPSIELAVTESRSTVRTANAEAGSPEVNAGGEAVMDRLKEATKEAGEAIEELRKNAEAPIQMDEQFAPHMKNVFENLSDVSEEEVQKISAALDREMSEIPMNATVVTEQLRQEYRNRMVAHSKAYAEMAADVDGYLAKEGTDVQKIAANMRKGEESVKGYRDAHKEALEQVDAATVKGIRSTIQMVKGYAELGLMSEDNAKKFMQSMAVIQGVFDIFEGGADLIEAFNNGYRSMAKATEAATKAKRVEQALQTTQFTQMKAYHALLLEEMAAANLAAMANERLASSRGIGAGVAGATTGALGQSATSAVSGMARSAGGVAAAGASAVPAIGGAGAATGGAAATGAAAMGLITTLAALGAAAGAVTLVLYELGEIVTGNADKQNSATMAIANAEVGLAVSAMRLTGAFEKTDSTMVLFYQNMSGQIDGMLDRIPVVGEALKRLNLVGDLAGAAASQAATERAQKKFDRDKIFNEARIEKENLGRGADMERGKSNFQLFAETARNSSASVGTVDANMGMEQRIINEAQDQIARNQKIVADFSVGVNIDPKEAEKAKSEIASLQREIENATIRQRSMTMSKGDGRMEAEMEIERRAMEELANKKTEIAAMADGQVGSEEAYADAIKEALYYEDQIKSSREKQAQISRESVGERLQAEQKVRDVIKSQIDAQTAQIASLDDQLRSSANNFAKMGDVEKDFAIKAIEKARTQGGSSLDDREKDLLRQVGTSESVRFANEGDMSEAKKFGFDKAFGVDLEKERMAIESTRTQLEAQLKTSYDVSVDVQFDSAKAAEEIASKTREIMREQNATLLQQLDQKLKDSEDKVTLKQSLALQSLSKQRS